MINTNRYIVASAIYKTMLSLLEDVDYCTAVNNYDFKLGLSEYPYEEPTDENGEVIESEVEEDRLLLSANPNAYPFLYNGSFEEIVRLYNTANSFDITESDLFLPNNSNKYLGVWNILPKKVKHSNGRSYFATEIYFICNVDKNYTTEQRDKKLFEPILDVFKASFMKELEEYPFVVHNAYGIEYSEDRGYNIAGAFSDSVGDYFCVLKITFELQIVDTTCEKYYEDIVANANRLYELLT